MTNIINVSRERGSRNSRRASQRKQLLFLLGIVVLVASGAGAYFWYVNWDNVSVYDEAAEDKKYELAHRSVSDVIVKVESDIEASDKAAVIRAYDESIEKVSDPYERAVLYYNKAMALERLDDKKAVLAAAVAASEADVTKKLGIAVDGLAANTAYDLNDKVTALKYYKKQRDYIESGKYQDMGNPLPGIEDRIAELEGEGV